MAGFYAARSWIIPPLPWLDLQAPLPPGFLLTKEGDLVHVFGAAGSFIKIGEGGFRKVLYTRSHREAEFDGLTFGYEAIQVYR